MVTAALIYIMAVISPGPNFIIVSRFSSFNSNTRARSTSGWLAVFLVGGSLNNAIPVFLGSR